MRAIILRGAAVCLALVGTSALAAVHYVDLNNAAPSPPYTTWASAARTIQSAVDVALAGDEIVVTNGVYQTGGRAVYGTMTNRVAVTIPLTVRSLNGPDVTVIQGYQVPAAINGDGAVRCVYLANGASLLGFTLTNGATRASGDYALEQRGGGVWCESASAVVSNCALIGSSASLGGGGAMGGTLNNCTLSGNSGYFGAGGGADGSTLNNCTLTGNFAQYGGGAAGGTLNNCTLTGNSAFAEGGGAYNANLNNCIVYYNTAGFGDANYHTSTLNYFCTTPLPTSGAGNLGAEPQLASASHLSAGSPCRGAGSHLYSSGVDIDGEPWANPPSIGCDEYYPGAITGPLSVAIEASYTNAAAGI